MSIRIVDMPGLGLVTDATSFVGEKAGSGLLTATALRDYIQTSPQNFGVELTDSPDVGKPFSGYTCYVTLSGDAVAASSTNPEMTALFQLTSATGAGAGTYGLDAFKVTLGSVCTLNPGSASGWAFNCVTNLAAGCGNIFGVGIEVDLNVNNQAYPGAGAPYATNIHLTGTQATGCYAQAAIVMARSGTEPLWNYGIFGADYGTAGAFRTAFISDQSNSPIVLQATGAHTNGIDFTGATFSAGTLLAGPNNTNISLKDAGGVMRSVVALDTSSNLQLGAAALTQITANQSLIPGVDNVYVLGKSGARWAAVWAANGTIQTSDPTQKTDIQPLPEALPIIAKLNPVTYRWRVGGYDGDLPREGRRTHWGFSAPDVKAAFTGAGRDFGGYVKAEDGTEALRPDQLIPVLWKACQEMAGMLEQTRAELADLRSTTRQWRAA
jgi:hypothetical protein